MLRFNKISIYLILITIASCKNSDEYRVDNEFSNYIQRFEDEAALRGRTFDLQKDGLIVEFSKLDNDVAGLCHYERPIRIEVDSVYWRAIGKTAGADQMKEDLLFHELGHGILQRKHLNTILDNGDWKSIMCGGDKVNGRAWNINYRGERRKYYLDELFDESTAVPDYMSTTLKADTSGFSLKVSLNFDTETQAGWKLDDNTNYKTSLESGTLRFQSKTNAAYLVTATTPVSCMNDFSYQLSLTFPVSGSADVYGIVWGYFQSGAMTGKDPMEYMSVNNQQRMYMGIRSWYSYYTELSRNQINNATVNTLKVVKLGTMLYYFINNTFSYCTQTELTADGNKFGFLVPPMGTVYVDNLSIRTKSASNVFNLQKSNATPTFNIEKVDYNDFKKTIKR